MFCLCIKGISKLKPQMLMQEYLERTKRFFQKTLRCIKSLLPEERPELLPIFSCGKSISSKFQELQKFCKCLSGRRDHTEVVDKKEGQTAGQNEGDEHCSQRSMCVPDQYKLKDLKEDKKVCKYSGEKLAQKCKSSYLSAQKLAQQMKEFEMMDVNDGEHVLDVEEVLHYYSLLTSPVYLDIVDQFFTDMYLEFHLPQPTRSASSSMRKLGCGSVHNSMRRMGCASVHSSMRKVGSPSVHSSMRKMGTSTSVHSSMRKMGTCTSVHSSMRKVCSPSIPGSMRKVGSPSIPGSMRKVDSTSIHSSMRSLGPLKI